MGNKQLPIILAIQAVGGKQKVLAQKMGVTEQYISKLKRRKTLPTNNPEKWVDVTGLSMRTLFPQFYEDNI